MKNRILEILFVKRVKWDDIGSNHYHSFAPGEWSKAYVKTNKDANIRLFGLIVLLLIALSFYIKFGTADHWGGKTFAQIFLGQTQHERDSLDRIYWAKENAKYKYKVGQTVKLLGTTGKITNRGDERLVGFAIFPIVDTSVFYRVSYLDNNGVLHEEIFTESELINLAR